VAIPLYIPPGKFSFFSFFLSAEGNFLLSSFPKFSEASKCLNTVDPGSKVAGVTRRRNPETFTEGCFLPRWFLTQYSLLFKLTSAPIIAFRDIDLLSRENCPVAKRRGYLKVRLIDSTLKASFSNSTSSLSLNTSLSTMSINIT